jgi:hypothetical protein
MREPIYYISELKEEITLLKLQNGILKHERDIARRMYCQAMADVVNHYRSPEDIAADRGWDCFAKETTNV